jgi:ATP-dependent exoDNAse (exonuclease V) beta subunit
MGSMLNATAADVAAVEADRIAQLAGWMASSHWQVSDRGPDGARILRPAQYRDVCILLPTRTHQRRLERALEAAQLPYRIESGALILSTQEVRDLLACLRAIEDPSDQVALVGALRSPAYGCADPDLVRWVEGGGRLCHEDPGLGPDGPVKDALASLAAFHARRHLLSPPALIEAFLTDRLLVAAAFGEPRPREAWRRLRYVVARARAFTATGRHTLRAFLDWIDGQARAEVREAESADAEPDEDALRILTVHGAKGLEFPIVILAGLGRVPGGRADSIEIIPDRQTGVLACRAGDWRTVDFTAAQQREKLMEQQEAIRLLYVAGTRARDHLVLSLHRGRRTEASPAAQIEARLRSFPGPGHALQFPETPPAPARRRRAPSAPLDEVRVAWGETTDETAWLAHRQEQVRRLTAPRTLSLDGTGAEQLWPWADEVAPENAAGDGDLEPSTTVRRLLRTARGNELRVRPGDDPTAVDQARAILKSEPYERALASDAWRRDVPLLAVVDGVVLDVIADLI